MGQFVRDQAPSGKIFRIILTATEQNVAADRQSRNAQTCGHVGGGRIGMDPGKTEILREAPLHEAAQRRLQRHAAVEERRREETLDRAAMGFCHRGARQPSEFGVTHGVDGEGGARGSLLPLSEPVGIATAAATAACAANRPICFDPIAAHVCPLPSNAG